MTTTPTTLTREPIKIVADILLAELGLNPGQIMLAYEKWDIPPDDQLYIALRYLGPGKVIGNVSEPVPTAQGLTERQSMTIRDLIQIDIMSFSGLARSRKEEVIMALGSILSEQLTEQYGISIARNVGDPVDAGSLEGQKWLNRFVYSVPVFSCHVKTKAATYFSSFQGTFYADDMPNVGGNPQPIPFDPTATPRPPEGI